MGTAIGIVVVVLGLGALLWLVIVVRNRVWLFFNPTRRCAACGKVMHWSPTYRSLVCHRCGCTTHDGKRH